MNILALDHGIKNIGLAWCQTGLDVVLPFGVIQTTNWKQQLPKLIKEEAIDKLVVGLPRNQHGERGERNMKRVGAFLEELKHMVSIPIDVHEETRSSKQADAMASEGSGSKRDERAAMVILQAYIESTQS
ncbi:MAG: Holliday junction resolvase RuvX [Candidatus Magasanikbacteria bacterium]|nr:Holliday junction resolvase RuvX [Candidatus Magasanikbacteria bacterium]